MRTHPVALALVVASATFALLLAPPTAEATHCQSGIFIFSRVGAQTPVAHVGNPSLDPGSTGCILVGEHGDTRYIYPHANEVLARYVRDVGVPTLTAEIEGLGFSGSVTMTRTVPLGGTMGVYNTPWIPIDPEMSGSITVTVALPNGRVATDTYRTIT